MFRSRSGNGNVFIQSDISWIFPAFVECPFVDIIFGICAFDFRRTGGIVQITAAFEGPQDIYTKTFIIEISGYITPEFGFGVPDNYFIVRIILKSTFSIKFIKYFLPGCRIDPC